VPAARHRLHCHDPPKGTIDDPGAAGKKETWDEAPAPGPALSVESLVVMACLAEEVDRHSPQATSREALVSFGS
jgi:hypothetical protein